MFDSSESAQVSTCHQRPHKNTAVCGFYGQYIIHHFLYTINSLVILTAAFDLACVITYERRSAMSRGVGVGLRVKQTAHICLLSSWNTWKLLYCSLCDTKLILCCRTLKLRRKLRCDTACWQHCCWLCWHTLWQLKALAVNGAGHPAKFGCMLIGFNLHWLKAPQRGWAPSKRGWPAIARGHYS